LDKKKEDITDMGKKRLEWIDVLKGITIYLVIIGHVIQYGNGKTYLDTESFWDNYIFQFIYSFHMPLFIFLSGFCFWKYM
jgi:fucose 4-O-acetylase-like acetyltransferase